MVSCQQLVDQLSRDLDCPICYRSKRLHCLPCRHAFCRACLEQWSHKTQKEDSSNCNIQSSTVQLTCPHCRASANIPNEGIKRLPSKEKPLELVSLRSTLTAMSHVQTDNANVTLACVTCFFGVCEPASVTLYQYCVENCLPVCDHCRLRYPMVPAVPSAPPLSEGPDCNVLQSLWRTGDCGGRHSDALFINDQYLLVTDYYDGKVLRLDAVTGQLLATGRSLKPYCMAYDPTHNYVLCTKYNSKCVHYFSPDRLKEVKSEFKMMSSSQLQGIARFADGCTVVAELEGSIAVNDIKGRCKHRWDCEGGMIPGYVTTADDRVIASFRDNDCVIIYNRVGKRLLKFGDNLTLRRPRGMAVDDKGRLLVAHESASGCAMLTCWDLTSGRQVAQLSIPTVTKSLVTVALHRSMLLLVYTRHVHMTTYHL